MLVDIKMKKWARIIFIKIVKKSMFNKELNTFSNLLISNFLILTFLKPDNVDFEISNYELFF